MSRRSGGRAARRRRSVRGWQPSRHHCPAQKMFLSRLGTGVFRPDRRSRPCSRARRAAAVPVTGPDATAAGASWRGARKPHLQQTRDEARHNPTRHARPSLLARRGRLVPRARRGSTRGVPDPAPKTTARRPNPEPFHARRQRAPGGLARRLGVAAARRLPCSPIPPEPASLFARRRRSSEAQPAQEPPSAAARQSCGTKASTQARNSIAMRLHTWDANTG
jgi:hypothetical protein